MEILLARHCSSSQVRGFILLDVLHHFEEDVALNSACGGVCTWASLRVAARRAPYRILHVAARASLRRAPRASMRVARVTASRASRFTARRKGARARRTAARGARRAARRARRTAPRCTSRGKGRVHTVDRRTKKRHDSLHDRVLGRNNWSPRLIPHGSVYVEQVFLDVVHHGVTAVFDKKA